MEIGYSKKKRDDKMKKNIIELSLNESQSPIDEENKLSKSGVEGCRGEEIGGIFFIYRKRGEEWVCIEVLIMHGSRLDDRPNNTPLPFTT